MEERFHKITADRRNLTPRMGRGSWRWILIGFGLVGLVYAGYLFLALGAFETRPAEQVPTDAGDSAAQSSIWDVDRLVWTGGAGGLKVGPETMLIETNDFPEEWVPVAHAAIDAYDILSEADDLAWTYLAPAALIEPGERTGEYRTADRELVTDDDGDSYISMEDFAVALVDELEEENGVHTYLGTGY